MNSLPPDGRGVTRSLTSLLLLGSAVVLGLLPGAAEAVSLYTLGRDAPSAPGHLYEIDPATGAATQLHSLPFGGTGARDLTSQPGNTGELWMSACWSLLADYDVSIGLGLQHRF